LFFGYRKLYFNKATALNTITLNNVTSGNSFAQWYPSPQAITVYGFEFFAWQIAGTNAVVPITCRIYNAGIDSMPTGTPLGSVTVNVDSTFGSGLLTTLRKKAIFSTPVTTSSPNGYVIAIETGSSINVAVVANSWSAAPANGRFEWLSSVKIGTTYIRSYNINIGGITFNADFLMQPFVSYNLTANFTSPATCMTVGTPYNFTNTSSAVVFNKFYNTRAFFNIPQFSCIWDYGDTSGSWYAVNGSRTYNYNESYTVNLYDSIYGWTSGCADATSKTIYKAPDQPMASNNGPICSGGTLKLFADTAIGATYYWTGPNGFVSTVKNPEIPSAGILAAGLYSVQTIIGPCSSTVATTYVDVINSFAASSNGPLCAGGNLNLNATQINGASYAWTGPNSFTSSIKNPSVSGVSKLDSGVYSVSISLAGCGVLGPFTTLVVVNNNPAAPTIGNNGPICVGDNLLLTASGTGSGNYLWIGPNGFTSAQQNPVRTSSTLNYAGNYSVTLTQNGCTSPAANTTVLVNTIPSAPSVSNNGPLCSGQVLSLTASLISGASYTWTGPNGFTSSLQNPTRDSLTLLDAGTYSVLATVNGCSSPAANTTVSITTNTPTPTASSNGPLCPGQNLQLSATGVNGATYSWTGPKSFTSNSQNPSIFNVNDSNAGIYSVTATTSACGTSNAATVILVVNSLPAAPNLGNDGPVCVGQTLNLTASTITGAVYYWTGPNGFSSNLQNPSVTGMTKTKAGLYSAYVSVSGCGTSSTNSTEVIVHAVPSAPSITNNAPVCVGDTLRLMATNSGLGPNASYTWSGPNNYSSSAAAVNINGVLTSDAGMYSVMVTDSGCSSPSSNTTVLVKTLPSTPSISSNSPLCEGANLSLQASAVSGATYFWEGPNGFASKSQNPGITGVTVSNDGTYSIQTLVNGCLSIPATLTVVVNPLPETPQAGNDGPVCAGNPINLTATSIANASYSWSGPNFTASVQNPVLTNSTTAMSGIYTVFATVAGCSSGEGSTNVAVNPIPAAPKLSSDPALAACFGDSLRFFAADVLNGVFEWTGPVGFGSNQQNPVLFIKSTAQGGTYTAKVTKLGCTSEGADLVISVHASPTTSSINGLGDVKRTDNVTYSVTGSAGSTYNWLLTGGSIVSGAGTNTVNVVWSVVGTGNITVIETNSAGCKGILQSKSVNVAPATGILENKQTDNWAKFYPNPVLNQLTIEVNKASEKPLQISLIDLTGRLVQTIELTDANGQTNYQLDLGTIKSGVYLLELNQGDLHLVKRLVKE
jgi:hypothetical protein